MEYKSMCLGLLIFTIYIFAFIHQLGTQIHNCILGVLYLKEMDVYTSVRYTTTKLCIRSITSEHKAVCTSVIYIST